MRSLLAEEGLAACASESATIRTPTGDSFTGLLPVERVCAVSIIRAGDSLLDAVMACDPNVAVGMYTRAGNAGDELVGGARVCVLISHS